MPIILIDNFLAQEDARSVLQEYINLRSTYTTARIVDGPFTSKIDQSFRRNKITYLNSNLFSATSKSDTYSILRNKVWSEPCRSLWHEGYYLFDIINYATHHELVVSRYGHQDFFKRHQDTLWDHLPCRLVSLIYYINVTPKTFSGGALTLWHQGEFIKIQPEHNLAVVFPSFAYHEVDVVSLADETWEHGRFSINYWMGFAS